VCSLCVCVQYITHDLKKITQYISACEYINERRWWFHNKNNTHIHKKRASVFIKFRIFISKKCLQIIIIILSVYNIRSLFFQILLFGKGNFKSLYAIIIIITIKKMTKRISFSRIFLRKIYHIFRSKAEA
jgi:hypothetical protein